MEELEKYRDTMTFAMSASRGTDQDELKKHAISNQLSMPIFGAPTLEAPIESTKPVSCFESRDNAIPVRRTGFQTPPTIRNTFCNAGYDIPTLDSWDLGETYPVAWSLQGIGLVDGEHASSQFSSRPLEEVDIVPRPLFLHRQALRFVFSS